MGALRAPAAPGSAALPAPARAFLFGTAGGESPLPLLPALAGESVLGGLHRSAKPRKTPRAGGAVGARGVAVTRGIARVGDEAAAAPGAAPGVGAADGPRGVVAGVVAVVAPDTTAVVVTAGLPADVLGAAAAAGLPVAAGADVAGGEDTAAAAMEAAAATAYALDLRTIRAA
ncbi:microtubule cross-linking factor 1-like [Brachypodium distachyon]|uniref:microtubule cross-linking factor 1-like n=1 Tax=Brachypodium distachyon TaxID=15368 RepID=UPI00052FDFEF|nr:microtubule cross-linking factor 1-like [Brachypodium distachyon]|eukprot:XP_010236827.1 microtubule cross-linking factor 1-like [Brachypodium distachyon]